MSAQDHDGFPQSVIEAVGYYVYLLRDPRDGQVFYIGKGTRNRVFAHARAAVEDREGNERLDRIREIIASGHSVEPELLRHGLIEKEAFEVESALIDYIGREELANVVQGHHADARGRMRVSEVIATYRAEPVQITEPSLLITVNRLYERNIAPERLYEITRGNWVLGERRNKAKFGIAVFRGLVRQVYSIAGWERCEARSPEQKNRNRWRFTGAVAPEMQHLVGGSVAGQIKAGAQNPIAYVNC